MNWKEKGTIHKATRKKIQQIELHKNNDGYAFLCIIVWSCCIMSSFYANKSYLLLKNIYAYESQVYFYVLKMYTEREVYKIKYYFISSKLKNCLFILSNQYFSNKVRDNNPLPLPKYHCFQWIFLAAFSHYLPSEMFDLSPYPLHSGTQQYFLISGFLLEIHKAKANNVGLSRKLTGK